MPSQPDLAKIGVREFARRFRNEMIPVNNKISFFSALPLSEDENKEYLQDPIAALPSAILDGFPKVAVLLVPYLEKPARKGDNMVVFKEPDGTRRLWAVQWVSDGNAVLVFAIKDRDVAACHYDFYGAVALLLAEHPRGDALTRFSDLVRDELRDHVHGEVNEESWRLKQDLVRRQSDARRDTKLFRGYVRQAFVDSFTLYLHGICCDIDVDTGPRQLPSRHIRKRLEMLYEVYPPPKGYAVFPEELNGK
ncbi:MAG: hypothetical protein ABSG25_13470 [Bryobacteraceae bacterium]